MTKSFLFATILAILLHAALVSGAPAPAPAEPAPAAPATHILKAVRLRPAADSFRLIFLFDHPAPYTLKLEPGQQRATLEFLNAALTSLPAELARIRDPRLSGVWLKQHDGGLVTLELRFPTTAIRVDHFSLDDPAAVVIDIFRTDGDVARVTGAPEETTLTPETAPNPASGAAPPAPPASAELPAVPQIGHPALPPAGMLTGSRGSALPPVPGKASLPTPVATARVVALAADSHGKPPAAEPPSIHSTGMLKLGEADPLDADYDYFPLSALRLKSPAALEIRDAFLERRWLSVMNASLAYLAKNKMNEETADVLYMLAEAKWQSSLRLPNEPLADMVNMFQQAARLDAGGDLGAFAAFRQAQAALLSHDFDTAEACTRQASASSREPVRMRALLMRIQAQEELRRFNDALATIATACEQTSSTGQRVGFLVKEGNIRTALGDYPGAWAAFQKASALDPKWINLYMDGGKNLARAALESGHLPEARAAVEFIINNFRGEGEEKITLALLYAEILMRQGDFRTAEDIYVMMLKDIQSRSSGAEALKKVYKLYPTDLLDGEARYCALLVRDGKPREAMAELNKSYERALHEGGPVARLEPAMQVVVPVFMEYAVAHNQPYEALGAWKYYGHAAETSAALRRRCLAPLAEALEQLEMNDQALQAVRELREDRPTSGTVSPLALAIQEARLRIKTGSPEQAAKLLEQLQAMDLPPERQAELGELLVQAYHKSGRQLEEAQALQSLADSPGCATPRREEALLQAGEIFMQNKMPAQTVELGLKGLLREKQALEQSAGLSVDPTRGNALRLLLARAYLSGDDLTHEKIVLEDLLRRPGLSAEQKAQAQILLSNNQRLNGRLDEVEQLYQAVSGDPAADDNWRKAATQMQQMLDWNRRHPDQAIDVEHTTATLGQ